MLRKLGIALLIVAPLLTCPANDWRTDADSLEQVLLTEISDSQRVTLYLQLHEVYLSNEPERAMDYANQAYILATKTENQSGLVKSMLLQCDFYTMIGEYNTALQIAYDALELAKNDPTLLSWCHSRIAGVHASVGNMRETLNHNKKSLRYSSQVGDSNYILVDLHNIGRAYIDLEIYDSALYYLRIVNQHELRNTGEPDPYSLSNIGNVFLAQEQYDSALQYHLSAYKYDVLNDQKYLMAIDQQFIAWTYFEMERFNEAKEYALESIKNAEELSAYDVAIDNYEILYQIYHAEGDYKNAFDFATKFAATKDTLYNKAKQSLLLGLETKFKLKEQAEKLALVEKQKTLYFILSIVSSLFIISLILIVSLIYRRQRVLRKFTKELEEANESKERLLSIISHDLRGSVGTLRTAAQAINEGMAEPEEVASLMKNFYPVADSAYDLLENLLTWAKCNREKISPVMERLSVEELVNKCINHVQYLADSKQVKIVYHPDEHFIFSDQNMMLSILRNILCNAIKFSHPESKVLISHEMLEADIQITVMDNGIGIDKKAMAKIFKTPEQVQNSGTMGERGSGLGIMICKTFVDALKGKIWAESEKGKGTTFYLRIPATS